MVSNNTSISNYQATPKPIRFKITHMQEAMFYDAIASSSTRYVTVLRYELSENVNTETLCQRTVLLAKRHEMLRTSFKKDRDGSIWHEVSDNVNIDFINVDSINVHFTDIDFINNDKINITSFMDEQIRISPFDDKLLKIILCKRELIIVFHHVLLDGWSINLLMNELVTEGELKSKSSPFRYYVKWLNMRSYDDDIAWWKRYLGETRVCSELPNKIETDKYERHELSFAINNSETLRHIAKELKVTAGRLIQAIWCMLIAYYNGGESLVLSVISGRSAPIPGIMEMIGMCVNTIPIITKLPKPLESITNDIKMSQSITFAEWIKDFSNQAVEAEKHGFCHISDIINGSMSHLLSIEPPFKGENFNLKSSNAELVTDFDTVFMLKDEINVVFAYNSFAYLDEDVSKVKNHFITMLNTIIENPKIKLEQISILSDEEILELTVLNENADILNIINHQTVLDFWYESVKLNKFRCSLVYKDIRLTYAQVSDIVDKLARALKVKGVGIETPVAVLLPRSERYVITELAVMTAGGIFIPLDKEWPNERIKVILTNIKPFIVIDEDTYIELLSDNTTSDVKMSQSKPQPMDAAYMIMTSGTTNVPKGVVVTHRNFANFCLWAKDLYNWKAGDSCALVMGFSFDGSMWDIWLPLISGGTLHILPDDIRLNINALGDYCRKEHITHLDLPVSMTDAFREIYRGENVLHDLRIMVTGGEEVGRNVPAPYNLSNEYGPTECTVCCSVGFVSDDETVLKKKISIGKPVPNMNVYILDQWGRLCPYGVIGEACFSGVQVTRGYYNDKELTDAYYSPNPFAGICEDHKTLYHSKDLMKWEKRNDGYELIFMGRMDKQVKINGYRVELSEIENVLCSHSLVKAVAATIVEAAGKRIYAYVVPIGEVDIFQPKDADVSQTMDCDAKASLAIDYDTKASLAMDCDAKVSLAMDCDAKLSLAMLYELIDLNLPSFMRPIIVLVNKIPLTSSGKIDYNQLLLLNDEITREITAPTTEKEMLLLSVVSRILGITDVGINHNYLEIGGNSINAMRIIFCLEGEGYKLTTKELIKSINLSEAAAKMYSIDLVKKANYSNNTFIPLSAQQAMVFLSETKSHALYTVTLNLDADNISTYEISKRLNKAAKLHDILRTTFELDDKGQIIGRIHDTHNISINADDFDITDSIDPLKDQLLSMKLCDHKLILRYHHIAFDGWSINQLINELLYNQFPETAPSFAEFANYLAAQTSLKVNDEAWWKQNVKDAKAISILPVKSSKEAEYNRITACSDNLIKKCINAAKAIKVTKTAFMLAALGVVINTFNKEESDLLVPFVASCRNDDNLMGMCASSRPVKISVLGESFNELAVNVQDSMLESISHWFVPQEIIGKLPNYLFVYDEGEEEYIASGDQNYDLVIKFSNKCEFIYNTLRVNENNVKRIAAYLESALMSALTDQISVISKDEYELITKIYADGPRLQIKHETAAKAFIAASKTYSSRIALETENSSYTYSELYYEAFKIADELNIKGFGKGDIIAFNLPRDAKGIIAQIGITLSGAAFLPLDPSWPESRINDILHDSGASAVITNELEIRLTGEKGRVPSDCAYIIYTSGTTGRPKGVIMTQSALANQIAWAIDEFNINYFDKMLHYVAFTFDPSIWTIFTTLSSGAALSLLSESVRLDPYAVACYIMDKNITRCTLPAAVSHDILKRITQSSLRTVFIGGEIPKKLPKKSYDYDIVNCYGPTETCINATFFRIPKRQATTNIIGIPVANISCYVLDTHGKPCPLGIMGELCIGGIQLAHGYLNRSSESDTVFVWHPEFGRIYKTGDYVVLNNDGTLRFYGRIDRQVKIRGNRIELLEIENAICRINGIIDAKVKLSDGELYAYIITEKDIPLISTSNIKMELSKRLPSYMLPRSIMTMESFPLTENSKIDYKSLPEIAVLYDNEYEESLSELEEAIALSWKAAIGLSVDYVVKRNDNFDDLGGHSLLLFNVVGLLSEAGIKADIKMLIEHKILKDLADEISHQQIISSPKMAADSTKNIDDYKLYIQKMNDIDLSEKRQLLNILITGGTGFLGSHVIREFFEATDAVIHLPIRGNVNKLLEVLSYYFGESGERMAASNRLKIYLTDISKEPPIIDAPIDAIYHTAADIRHYAPEDEMYSANVGSTENMLTFAKRHLNVLFAHISTTSAVNMPFIRESDTGLGPVFDNIYQRTKQAAEERVFEAGKNGLKYEIFRIGHVSPGFNNGSVARNWEINAMLRLINSMLLTKLLPEQDYKIGYGYVDKIASTIRLLSQPTNLEGLIFHIDNDKVLRLSEIFKLAGFPVNVLKKDELTKKLRIKMNSNDEIVRGAALEYLGRLSQGSLERDSSDIVAGKLSMDATLLLLKRLGFEWPQVTAEYINNIIKGLRKF